jgi:hypothetical protein
VRRSARLLFQPAGACAAVLDVAEKRHTGMQGRCSPVARDGGRARPLTSHQPNCRTSSLARRFSLAVASESWTNAASLSLLLMAVEQASSSVWTTRRMADAVCSLLNEYSRQREHFKVENIKRRTPKPFKLAGSNAIDDTFCVFTRTVAELIIFVPLITLAAEPS